MTTLADVFGEAAHYAPQPDRLQAATSDIQEVLAAVEDAHPVLVAIAFAYGSFLRRVALAQPHILSRATWDQIHDGPDDILALAAISSPAVELGEDLRLRRNATHAKIALAQILGAWTPRQVWESLSSVADIWVKEALGHAWKTIVDRFGLPNSNGIGQTLVLLAFGKQGVRELNFSSDLDLVFVCSDDEGETVGGKEGSCETPRFFERVATTLMALLQDVTENGFVYCVDVRLRPNGSRGVLVPTAETFLDYHRQYASNWERIALLRARPIAGDIGLGTRLLSELESHVFPQHLDFESIESMRQIKEKINREAMRTDKDKIDLKHGYGGIRELEFLVQNLQIIFGGKRYALRTRETLGAIARLAEAEVIPETIAAQLADAYTFLRHIENTVQARDDRQTYTLPTDRTLVEVARAAGFRDDDAGQTLLATLKRHTELVAREFNLLYAKSGKNDAPVLLEVFELLENESLSQDQRGQLLLRLGFRDHAAAQATLERLIEGPKAKVYGNRAREQFQNVLPKLIDAVLRTSDPDQALQLLQEFVSRIGGRSYLYALLNENREVIQALVRFFASSLFAGRLFIRNPELIDALVLKSYAIPKRSTDDFRRIIAASLVDVHADESDIEIAANVLRRAKEQEVLRVGFHDLANDLTLLDVQDQLSSLAEALVEKVFELAFRSLKRKLNVAAAEQYFVPVALGKLGSRELNYGSDLDLLFVVAESDDLALESAIRGAQKMLSLFTIRTREGILYDVDMRLRPSGNQGLLVTSADAFKDYHQRTASIWERVALVKARPLVDNVAAQNVRKILHAACYSTPLTKADIEEMARIRDRMVGERGDKEPLKAGIGGTADIEIATALTQLRFGAEFVELQSPSPQTVLGYFSLLPEPWPNIGQSLQKALFAYRRLETRLHLLLDRPASAPPQDAAHLRTLSSALGFETAAEFSRYYGHLAEEVRAEYLKILALLKEQV